MKKMVVFSGAGISAESGLKTFRDSDGLWEEYNVMDVATPEAWKNDPKLVLEFYNKRKAQVKSAEPNLAHKLVAELESKYDVQVITQNIDNLHERAGSSKVLHLHGLITQAKSSNNDSLVYDIGFNDIKLGDFCDEGSQLRPNIVWFGEDVPNMTTAFELTSEAEILLIIGTSLNVYPAAGIVHYAPATAAKYLIDPQEVRITDIENLTAIREKATVGLQQIINEYL